MLSTTVVILVTLSSLVVKILLSNGMFLTNWGCLDTVSNPKASRTKMITESKIFFEIRSANIL